MHRDELRAYLDVLLDAAGFRDYCPNGLQVEGRAEVRRVVFGVSASQALVDAAVARKADALLVHHGWFWKSEDGRVVGHRRRRMAALLGADINLFAFHLPLDAHPRLGNNAQLAARLGWRIDGRFAEQDIGFTGTPAQPTTAGELAAALQAATGREPLLIGDPATPVARLGWCSGGAQGYFEQAIEAGSQAYVSGEISENTVHVARETGVRRDLGEHGARRARDRGALHRRGASRHRTLRRHGAGRAPARRAWPRLRVRRGRQPGLSRPRR